MKSINAFGGMSGRSSAINVVNTLIHKASFNDYPVLITGETGVGKSLAAECIHRFSRRKEKFFLHQSCSNISSDLFESDFFGHEKGTFTGAVEKKIGKIELAEGGSVFLDEISEISPQSQSKFLLFLDKGKFFRLGGLKEISADVRIMAATNRNLEKEMKAGCFRRDLYYRLNVFEIHIPSLKERKEDIPLLIDEILSEAEERNRTRKRMSPQAVQKLIEYDFPGNIRELENVIISALILSEGDTIMPADVKFKTQIDSMIEENMPESIFYQMTRDGKSFWEVVHKPFLQRELNRREVKNIINLGLKEVRGSYKKLMFLFNAGESQNDYKKFMKVIDVHRLK